MISLLCSLSLAQRDSLHAALWPALLGLGLILAPACGGDTPQSKNNGGEVAPDAGAQSDAAAENVHGAPAGAETHLSATSVQAGTAIEVTCGLLDDDGEPVLSNEEDVEPRISYAPEDSFVEEDDLTLIPTTAGDAEIACEYPSLSLIDDTPVELEIAPGQAYTTEATLADNIIEAGESTSTECEVFDAYENRIESASPQVVVDADNDHIDVTDDTLTITETGVYTVGCEVDGADEMRGDELEVTPAPPADLAISPVPDEAYYGLGQVVEVAAIATDEYGNRVDGVPLAYDSSPSGEGFGHGRFRYWEEGSYTVTVTVDGETKDDVRLEESVDLEVNGQGPSITCDSPANGDIIDATPDDTITVSGTVDDAQGIDSLEINGDSVSVDSNGSFDYEVDTRFGVNFVDIRARDAASSGHRQENSTTCAFLIADAWADEDRAMDDSVSLALEQEAVDDGYSYGSIDSLNDILLTVLESDGLEDEIDATLASHNGGTLASGTGYQITHDDVHIYGPHSSSLDLISGGMALDATVRDVDIDVYIDLALGGADATINIEDIDASLEFSTNLQWGEPNVSVRTHTVDVEAGNIHIDVSGIPGFVDSALSSLAEGTIQSTVEDELEEFVENDVNDVLDGVVGNLDVSSFGTSFSVPRLDGSGSIQLAFDVGFSTLDVDSSRALFGLETKFEPGSTRRGTPSKGVPLPNDDLLYTDSTSEPITAAIHIGTLNHALHALWRGGMFDAHLDDSSFDGALPDGAEIELSTGMPPVAALQKGDQVDLMLGALSMEIVYPGLFDEPVEVRVGALARSGISLSGDDNLDFHDIELKELYFNPKDISLSDDSRRVLESFLIDVLQNLVDSSLNDALPALPIPSFEIPYSLWGYGLPTGDDLGLTSPSLDGDSTHFVLEGSFGVLP